LDRAAAHFNAALAMNASPDMNTLARVGLGRSLLFRGTAADHSTLAAQAATAVAGVPAAFQYVIFHSLTTGSQNNGIWDWVNNDEIFSVSTLEGTNGLDFRADSRVPNRLDPANGASSDGTAPHHHTLKFATATASVPLATGTEAELIRAEADLRAGNFASALTRLNTLRAAGGLTPLADPGSQAAREDLLFRERAFWLWGTGHRLGDLRRLIRQYNRTEDGVFPTGLYRGGPATYGDNVNLPVPVGEAANPTFTGCIDRNP
ncbi:MAG: RagB/SusD family nutrient uptake outer membrane protein, partial [Gemmatimonadaceae bacterium]